MTRRILLAGLLAVLPAVPSPPTLAADPADVVRPATDFSRAEPFEANPGGAGTSTAAFDADAFSHPAANLDFEERLRFFIGNGFFRRSWVTAPSSTQASDGLGPLYNARSCQGCHLKDGRGHPPEGPEDGAVSMLLRLSVPPRNEAEAAALKALEVPFIPEPTYGSQLQDFAIPGHLPEGRMRIAYEEVPVSLAGGETVGLRKPSYSVVDLNYGPLEPGTLMSPRIAPQMIGLGLLEAIDEADILAGTDPEDADGDGISGRANRAWSPEHGRAVLGRFGWKAGAPTLDHQNSAAMAGDIGMSNPMLPDAWGDCTDRQGPCRSAPHGDSPQFAGLEAPSEVMDEILFYVRNLAVPARRDVEDAGALRGKKLFYGIGCADCHRPKYVTPRTGVERPQAYQLIWPYTDLLLHDMGPGLADGRPEGLADGREWRTPPLWGIGLTEAVNGHTYYLHDGRARNLKEAILWHGGEAQPARDAFAGLPAGDREALLKFVGSL
ncbi:di-heme oxidoredictase family protein [Arenibaculum sp.]|uniref:di-heme oxidoreductase family protein n=1 Tax=Arenibaculum sp. TaxID=2865862 RepID=UPI002E10ACEE|nr:di-heme oxidoredictase family protein [Arenibaculum sp.]